MDVDIYNAERTLLYSGNLLEVPEVDAVVMLWVDNLYKPFKVLEANGFTLVVEAMPYQRM